MFFLKPFKKFPAILLVLLSLLGCKSAIDPIPPATYSIVYDGNGNTDGEVPVDSHKYEQGESVTVAGAGSLVKVGSTFSSWNLDSNGGGTSYAVGTSFEIGAENQILFAQWTPDDNTVVFDANGGSGSMSPQIISSGTTANLTANSFNRDGWSFAGWAETVGGSVVYTDGSTYSMGSKGTTLYAIWNANSYTITFHANTGLGGNGGSNHSLQIFG